LNGELPRDWIEKARIFLRDAERHLNEGVYWLSCFNSQQAAELYLKAFLVMVAGLHPFTHDLVELLDALRELNFNPPEELYTYADALTPHYTMARYPGRKPVTYNRGLAERCLKYARTIIRWVEEQASKLSSKEN